LFFLFLLLEILGYHFCQLWMQNKKKHKIIFPQTFR
jgi:hypothetical protein